jgi:hypothetical protein
MFEVWAKVISIKRSAAWLFTTFYCNICQMSRNSIRRNSISIKDFRLRFRSRVVTLA